MTFVSAAWLTRQPLADRIAVWALRDQDFAPVDGGRELRRDFRVIEPSAGKGAFLIGLLKAGVDPGMITAIELERGRFGLLKETFPTVGLIHRDFLSWEEDMFEDGGPTEAPFTLALMNPPSDDGTDTEHVLAATHVARRVVCLVRLAFVTGTGRQEKIFEHCKLTRQVILASRPDFEDARTPEERLLKSKSDKEADGSPKHDWTILELVRMTGRVQGWTRDRDPFDNVRTEWW